MRQWKLKHIWSPRSWSWSDIPANDEGFDLSLNIRLRSHLGQIADSLVAPLTRFHSFDKVIQQPNKNGSTQFYQRLMIIGNNGNNYIFACLDRCGLCSVLCFSLLLVVSLHDWLAAGLWWWNNTNSSHFIPHSAAKYRIIIITVR